MIYPQHAPADTVKAILQRWNVDKNDIIDEWRDTLYHEEREEVHIFKQNALLCSADARNVEVISILSPLICSESILIALNNKGGADAG